MGYSLYRPGSRKNNKFWITIIKVGGKRHEYSTKALTKADARRTAEALERHLITAQVPRSGDPVTFAQAAACYANFKGLDLDHPERLSGRQRDEAKRLVRPIAVLGRERLADISHADLVDAALRLHGSHTPQTRNRECLNPSAAVLHYAANNGWCPWMRVALFKEPKPKTRAVSHTTAATLLAAAPAGPKRLFLLWSFRMGTRVSDTLRVHWDDLDLTRAIARMHIRKTNTWVELPLHPELVEELAVIPSEERTGWLLPWRDKSGVYFWLRPLVQEVGVAFTPHMARHSLGSWLNADGAGLKTIMQTLTHSSPKSSLRYQNADTEVVRAATARLPRLRGAA